MDKTPLLFMTGLGVVGYGVFHGHRGGVDCWLCQYRGLMFLSGSIGLGLWLALQEK